MLREIHVCSQQHHSRAQLLNFILSHTNKSGIFKKKSQMGEFKDGSVSEGGSLILDDTSHRAELRQTWVVGNVTINGTKYIKIERK